ncbi:GntR family transcriptional regulator [Desulfobacterales bacterium HSG16]|nr:GntR family transcriptional regulator [Desulfobacterales bacterium HSG16]
MLNSKSPLPLYHQLSDIILARIRSGEYPPETKIPSENKLAEDYAIGRPTARQAIDILVRKGLLKRKRGSGTFVCSPEKEVDLFSLAGTISSFHKKGISVETRIIAKTRLVKVGNKDLENPFAGKKAFFFSRLSLAGQMPVLSEDIYLEPKIFAEFNKVDMEDRSLSQIVEEKYYMKPTGGRQNFRIMSLSGKRAENMEISTQFPVLAVKRFLNFPQAKDAIYAELYCRTDSFVFSQTIGGTSDD